MSPAERRRGRIDGLLRWFGVLAVVLGSVLLPAPAQADALVASEPGVRQELEEAPGWVTLAFGAEVDPGVAKVLVTDTEGANVTTGSLIVEGTNVTTQLQDELLPGTYTVRYRVNGPDGEPEGGAYQFAYGAGDFSEPPDPTWSGRAEEPEAMNDPDPNAARPRPSSTVAVPDVEVEREDSAAPTPSGEPSDESTPGAAASAGSTPAPTPSPTVSAPTGSPGPGSPGAGLDVPPWPVWLALGAFGTFLIIAAVAFLRSRR